MTDNQPETPETPAADPYAGARAMGITVPAPVPAEAPAAPETTGDTDADYAAYLKWRDSQKAASVPASVTVTPAAEAPELPAVGPVQTPLSGKLRGIAADVIDVIQALEAAEE
jgi:hypothetical protein